MGAAASRAACPTRPTSRCANAAPAPRKPARSTRWAAKWCGCRTARARRTPAAPPASRERLLLQCDGLEQFRVEVALPVGLEVHAVRSFDFSLLVERFAR